MATEYKFKNKSILTIDTHWFIDTNILYKNKQIRCIDVLNYMAINSNNICFALSYVNIDISIYNNNYYSYNDNKDARTIYPSEIEEIFKTYNAINYDNYIKSIETIIRMSDNMKYEEIVLKDKYDIIKNDLTNLKRRLKHLIKIN